ncbi:hypothetical protein LS684_08665 [Cytobacillus spongiae]|uniref:hypothetical protein n=1 Tax=Cytobacillus spongiae TaxID=2901381 RepID=UPI001F210011|nr:hypothetical protein [Cytobacillus spongiae]UII57490.1 hypothetical protein LS684_08665 [Cytobacillus spongiae]
MSLIVIFEGDKIGNLSEGSLHAFSLFCEQQGLLANIDESKGQVKVARHRIHLPIIRIECSQDQNQDVCRRINQIVENCGIEHTNREESEIPFNITALEANKASKESITLHYPNHLNEKIKNIILQELNISKFTYHLKDYSPKKPADPRILVQWEYPANASQDHWKGQLVRVIARILIRYYKQEEQTRFFSYLPNEMVKNFLVSILTSTKPTNSNPIKPPNNPQAQKQARQTIVNHKQAEVFLDYRMIPPKKNKEDSEYMIFANLIVKNVGNVRLEKPVICLQVDPIKVVQIQGQAIPEKMVQVLATTSNGSEKGWKYVYSDWLKRVKEKGEYWVTPIEEVTISPNESVSYSFKMFFPEPPPTTEIVVSGFAYFNEGKEQYSGNNHIHLDF